jgi:glutamine amidotransferase
MCELLGMNCNVPTDIRFSFSGLIQRGGRTGPHSDGWGIAFYNGRGCRTFHDPHPSCQSEVAKLVRNQTIKSLNVICHIRRATNGRVCLENTHPFVRELWGCSWTLAHNGKLKGFPTRPRSERSLQRFIGELARDIDGLGPFNMLLCDSRDLYCHCSTNLNWLTRRAPFGPASLIDTDMTVDFAKETTPRDIVTVIATHPLTDHEPWIPMDRGSLVIFRDGLPAAG